MNDSAQPLISVVIPMYNEAENAATTLKRVAETLAGLDYELLPVNDGSTDATAAELERLAAADARIRPQGYGVNAGRGRALRTGFAAARGTYVASIDADLSYEPEYILRMVETLEAEPEVDLVLASAYMPGGAAEGVPFKRLWLSRLGNKVLNLSMSENIYTSTCVVRCYRRFVLDCLDLESDGKEIHLEVLSRALAMGFRVREIPAVLRSRKLGKSKFAFGTTASSHLLFTVLERPMLLFGLLGAVLSLVGVLMAVAILIMFAQGTLNPDRPLITVMLLFVLGGMQILSLGFLAAQMTYLRKEILKIRRSLARYALKGSDHV
ncbi:MAG: Undecaprenyl-phosphate 4-deoxy-4-formamido-L-arabinose transferase [Deltaproteobacteria bacterium ADurb.Bin510]|nr:MAG: Undecaprenyl-phosphate 4-deoxy-4-formamido-L-arabinose transferase [Deltaproteobacteria bacterium ADurb.Bin510]